MNILIPIDNAQKLIKYAGRRSARLTFSFYPFDVIPEDFNVVGDVRYVPIINTEILIGLIFS